MADRAIELPVVVRVRSWFRRNPNVSWMSFGISITLMVMYFATGFVSARYFSGEKGHSVSIAHGCLYIGVRQKTSRCIGDYPGTYLRCYTHPFKLIGTWSSEKANPWRWWRLPLALPLAGLILGGVMIARYARCQTRSCGCLKCGYDLSGSLGVCPECGEPAGGVGGQYSAEAKAR